jgi:single-strand DNA-binding protein
MNWVFLMGNVTRDIELRSIGNGAKVCDLGLAVNERKKTATGEWVDDATFIDVTLWNRTAEIAAEYLGKGSSVLIEGRLKLEKWEVDGQKRSKLKVICHRMKMLDGKKQAAVQQTPRISGGFSEDSHDEIPF